MAASRVGPDHALTPEASTLAFRVHSFSSPVRTWRREHDNSWIEYVVEQPDGTFAAWAASDGAPAKVDYVEDCLENAQRAAEFALRRGTRHHACSPDCGNWCEQPPVGT